jgi:hypothetical protein
MSDSSVRAREGRTKGCQCVWRLHHGGRGGGVWRHGLKLWYFKPDTNTYLSYLILIHTKHYNSEILFTQPLYWHAQYQVTFFRRVRTSAKSDSQLCHDRSCVRLSFCPHETTRLPLDGFWWNFIRKLYSIICREKSSFTKIRQEQRVRYTKTVCTYDNILLNSS